MRAWASWLLEPALLLRVHDPAALGTAIHDRLDEIHGTAKLCLDCPKVTWPHGSELSVLGWLAKTDVNGEAKDMSRAPIFRASTSRITSGIPLSVHHVFKRILLRLEAEGFGPADGAVLVLGLRRDPLASRNEKQPKVQAHRPPYRRHDGIGQLVRLGFSNCLACPTKTIAGAGEAGKG